MLGHAKCTLQSLILEKNNKYGYGFIYAVIKVVLKTYNLKDWNFCLTHPTNGCKMQSVKKIEKEKVKNINNIFFNYVKTTLT